VSASCIYEGTIRHRRSSPPREFRHRLALAYVDLEELPQLLDGRLLRRRTGALRFRRGDYHGGAGVRLADAVRDSVCAQTGIRPLGPIRVLTQLRSFGHCFNPVSFYYCMSEDGERVQAILAEVTNTPWRERHAYVLGADGPAAGSAVDARGGGSTVDGPHACSPAGRVLDARFEKALHVSPFMGMDHSYRARASAPGETLSVHIESSSGGERVFDATLSLRRRELTRASARRMALRYPLATVRVLALIYAQALALKLAGVRVHAHPRVHGGSA
jgi:DUF1365 family protein